MTSLQIQAAVYRLCNCKSICPRHPDLQWEVIKRLAAHQHHGNLTPPRIAPSCPHLLRRIALQSQCFNARLYGRTGVSPHCLSSPYRKPSGIYSRLFLAPYQVKQTSDHTTQFSGVPAVFTRHIVAQPLTWLMLITIAMGMCLMNGYSVVKEQRRP